jgi:hypothetical protein
MFVATFRPGYSCSHCNAPGGETGRHYDVPTCTPRTRSNSYGIYRSYPFGIPSYTPDELYSLDVVSDSTTFAPDSGAHTPDRLPWWSPFSSSLDNLTEAYFAPFLNASVFRLMNWFYNGSNNKSLSDLDNLVNNVILATDFKTEDLVGFRATREAERLDKVDALQSRFPTQDGWIETSVRISLPSKKVTHATEADAPKFDVPGLFHRRLIYVIKAALQETVAQSYHFSPFQEFWQPSPDAPPERIWSELYTADAFIAEHEKIQSRPQDGGLENVIIGLMLWSDSTHLTSFGNASLWPIYLYIGNLSKYTRAKPTTFSAHHVAYIPKVSLIGN